MIRLDSKVISLPKSHLQKSIPIPAGTVFLNIISRTHVLTYLFLMLIWNCLIISEISADENDLISLPVSRPVSESINPVPESSMITQPFETNVQNDPSSLSYQRHSIDTNQIHEFTTESTTEAWNSENVLQGPVPGVVQEKPIYNPDFLNHQESFFWMAGGDDKIGMTRIGIRGEVPLTNNMTFSPFYYVSYLDGPRNTDLPARLYETGIEIQWIKIFNPRFQVISTISPMIQSDFDNDTSDAFRLIAKSFGIFIYSQQTQFIFGAAYLDREDIKALPIAGLIHQFNPGLKMELVFPRPKISLRVLNDSQISQWLYLGGEFGGGSWAIRRSNAARSMDIATYSDLRLILGLDTKKTTGETSFLEIGYVFDRELEYKSDVGNFDPDETFFVRVGTRY